jgi:hypothetical protein
VSVTDPTRPSVLGELATGVQNTITSTVYTGVAVNSTGTMAVMAMGTSGIWVVDLTTPTMPRQAGSYLTASSANAVVLNSTGTLAYVAINTGLQILNLSQCQPPFTSCTVGLSGSMGTAGTDVGIAVSGPMVYLANQNGALYQVDATNVQAPVLRAGAGLSGGGRSVAVSGLRAVVLSTAATADYLDIVDLTTSPLRVGRAALGTPGTGKGVDVVNNTVYVAANTKKLMVYDITTPSLPVFKSSGYAAGSAFDVRVFGTMAYIADSPATIDIVGLGQ